MCRICSAIGRKQSTPTVSGIVAENLTTAMPMTAYGVLTDELSNIVRAAFSVAARHAQASLDPLNPDILQPDALVFAQSRIFKAVAHTVALILRMANERTASISRLPLEIIADVLSHLSVHERLNAALICHQWRTAALAYPSIWTDLTGFGLASSKLAVALHRSKDVGVDIHVQIRGADSGHFFPVLRMHMHHIRRLSISISDDWRWELNDALARKAPRLEEASVEMKTMFGSLEHKLRDDVFDGYAPRLNRLDLSYIAPPACAPALQGLRNLKFMIQLARAEELQTLCANYPALESYELHVTADLLPNRGPHVVAPPPPRLQVLSLPRCYSNLLSAMPHAEMRRVVLGGCDGPVAMFLLRDLDQPVRMVLLENSILQRGSTGCYAVGGADALGRERVALAMASHSVLILFTQPVMQNLRSLVTEAYIWAPTWSQLLLPQLTTLHLILRKDSTVRALPTCFITPQLRILRLSARHDATHQGPAPRIVFHEDMMCYVDKLLNSLSAVGDVIVETDGLAQALTPTPNVTSRPIDVLVHSAVLKATSEISDETISTLLQSLGSSDDA
ncbi:hypothetical protein EXIGLDRAFT_268335 [Exidia glandulosa HHB12029]|uniref:F-box domain-containing protein n=1 Tax=Exidia glandulosa HHB12029 TaxID=1314781 RepID=A0A165DPJ0_EXIGL|nr:hypothetical protein EXIGLDRAFT_268335 [Exidia glandulosa HHB12029]